MNYLIRLRPSEGLSRRSTHRRPTKRCQSKVQHAIGVDCSIFYTESESFATPCSRYRGLLWSAKHRLIHNVQKTRSCHPHGRAGKTPCNAMQKLSVKYGCILLCGWLPPVIVRELVFTCPVAG